jgi:hypothetical protein
VKSFDIRCGGFSSLSGPIDGHAVHMDVEGSAQNVNLKIADITKAMVKNIPDVLLDLLEVAAYVYCADQRLGRGSGTLPDYGSDWRRDMRFTIPVRLPDLWESAGVKEPLRQTLGFLSDDTYSFSFVKAPKPLAQKSLYFSGLIDGTFVPDEIGLFSGGLDSFAGAVEDLVDNHKNLALVGHHSATKVLNVQKNLIEGLRKRGLGKQLFHIPINVTNSGVAAREYTQRTRSFLFASLGVIIARMFGKDRLTFYENGVVSINIPIAKDVKGGRATRTTHPKVLRGFEAIFSALLEREIAILTPLEWSTKKEVTQKIGKSGFEDLLSKTVSCTRPREMTTLKPHCGSCSQCIDRRFAILAAGMGAWEPEGNYGLDLLTADRSLEADVRMAVAYVKFFQTFASSPKSRFVSEYPQVASAIANFPDVPAETAKNRIYEMYQRHSADVLSVIADGTAKHMNELVRGLLPPGCLLSMCFNRTKIEVSPASGYDQEVKGFLDTLKAPVCEFTVDGTNNKILFKGGFCLESANFKLFSVLLANFRNGKASVSEIAFVPAPDLAAALHMSEASLRQLIGRLRDLVTRELAVDLGIVIGINDFIENKERAGYRLSPALREVARADL